MFPRVGAFEQLFGPGRGEFEQKFSNNSNARGLPAGGGGGGMLKLRFYWYIKGSLPLFYYEETTSIGLASNKRSMTGRKNRALQVPPVVPCKALGKFP